MARLYGHEKYGMDTRQGGQKSQYRTSSFVCGFTLQGLPATGLHHHHCRLKCGQPQSSFVKRHQLTMRDIVWVSATGAHAGPMSLLNSIFFYRRHSGPVYSTETIQQLETTDDQHVRCSLPSKSKWLSVGQDCKLQWVVLTGVCQTSSALWSLTVSRPSSRRPIQEHRTGTHW